MYIYKGNASFTALAHTLYYQYRYASIFMHTHMAQMHTYTLTQTNTQGDRPARAYEAAARLNTTQSLEGALRLANHMRAGPLAERISKLVETRMMEDTQAAAMDLHDDDDGYDDDGGQHGGNDGQARRVISRHGGGDDEGMGGDGVEAVGGKENTSTPAVSAMALLGKGGKGNMHANTYVIYGWFFEGVNAWCEGSEGCTCRYRGMQ